jgi:CubicO group peptidase (beta-lactamase class C family)
MFAPVWFTRVALCVSALLMAPQAWAQNDRADISSFVIALGDRDPEVRWASVVALTHIGADAVPSLVKALADEKDDVRANAALTLGRIGKQAKAAVPGLTAALKDRSSRVRENAAEALGSLGPDAGTAVEALLVCLSDRDPYVAGKSAEALSRIGPTAVAGLIGALDVSDPATRWSATIALEKMGQDASPALPALTRSLGDASSEVRWGAAVALGNIGAKARSAVPALMRALSDEDQDVRQAASLALDRIGATVTPGHTDWQQIAATIDTLTKRLMRETHVPGVTIALINHRALVWSGQYGSANMKSGEPVRGETMFEACSMSKPVFAWVVMKLVESGKLDLDRPLVEYLNPLSLRGQADHRRITARMVLSHTSGLPNWRKGEEERDGPLPVTFAPGSKFGYSGEGFYYLQRVVEHITDEPFDVYARRTLFDPMGLKHMSFAWTEELDATIAGGHDSAGTFLQKSRYTHPNAAYTLYTSAGDYARFLIEIMRHDRSAGQSITQRSVDTMLSRQVSVTSREPIERPGKARGSAVYWGLGWSINATAQGDIIHHSGANRSGFRCFCQFNPATGSGIVIMTNGTGGGDLWTRLISRVGNL